MKLRIFHQGEPVDVEIGGGAGRWEIAFGEARHEVSEIACSDSGGTLLVDGRPTRYLAHRSGARIRIAVRGEAFEFDLAAEAGPSRSARAAVSPETRSPMPGKVLQVTASVGAAVKPGDPLLILEAMKMENVLAAEVAGKVAEVHVQPGDMVEPGKLLVVIRPDP